MELNIDYMRIAYALRTVVASIVLAQLVKFLLRKYVVQITKKTRNEFDDKILVYGSEEEIHHRQKEGGNRCSVSGANRLPAQREIVTES